MARQRQGPDRRLRKSLKKARAAARAGAGPLATRVHDLRSALKKAKAVLRLVEPAVGNDARRLRRKLSAIGRRFSPLRDAGVVVDTFDGIMREAARSRAVVTLRARLAQRRREGEDRQATEEELHRAARALRKARRRGERLLRRGAGRRALAEGFADGYRRARNAMTAAGRADTPEAFHAWRKAVKVHAHHARIFADAGVMSDRAAPLAALAEALGSAHDLALLEEGIRAECASPASTRAYAPLLAAVQAHRQAVERAALAQGRRLFRRPSAQVHRAASAAPGLRNSKR